ncbi:hypothetical protein NP493_22g01024 [Ridgeia piscesae]|uniref:Uncharacterized protein n=1 Tax=Ridgeia piscesae TaxID=27915 RepID=A0AAD9PDW1_RIDPI|nr:hypothetical protein NP493_22g01024 [Ridgeia piscesae]
MHHLREQTAYDGGIVKVADNRPTSEYAARRINSPTMPLLLYAFIGCCLVVISGVTAKPSSLKYAVIIDAGSTDSRVRVYSWHERASSTYKLPRFFLTLNYKVKPGHLELREKPQWPQVAREWPRLTRQESRPEEERSRYTDISLGNGRTCQPVHPLACTNPSDVHLSSGMRMLLETDADAVMKRIHKILTNKSKNRFKYRRIQSRVLSGEEEGAFGWLSVNYLNNLFPIDGGAIGGGTASKTDDSWGITELGGASLQIAFIPSGSLRANKFPVKVLGTQYTLYVHSYLGYGQKQVLKKITDYLRAKNGGQTSFENPCMLKGDAKEDGSVTYRGTGNPKECRKVFRAILDKANCLPQPCGLGRVYQPTIPRKKKFFELSAFAYTINALGILKSKSTMHTVSDITSATERYCAKTLDQLKQETGRNGDYLSTDCAVGVYMEVLFKDIYGFKSTAEFTSGFNINGAVPEWTLGAMIYEYEREKAKDPKGPFHTGARTGDAPRFHSALILVAVLAFLAHGMSVTGDGVLS